MSRIFKAVFLVLVFISIISLFLQFGYAPLSAFLGISERAGIRIESNPPSVVDIDGKTLGNTPYESDQLSVGSKLVELKATVDGKAVAWRGFVNLNAGTVTLVNRNLKEQIASSSGEIISLVPGSGVMVVSTPDGVDVSIDGVYKGKSPLYLDTLSEGDHIFILGRSSYLKRSIKVRSRTGYRLVLNADLAISEADLTNNNADVLKVSQQVKIKPTPTGYLIVRDGPSQGANEISRVNPGEVYSLLEETTSWFKISLPDGKSGYVSTTYATKN